MRPPLDYVCVYLKHTKSHLFNELNDNFLQFWNCCHEINVLRKTNQQRVIIRLVQPTHTYLTCVRG